jgi:glycosyltransferase involved in cell wall biosynthesis
MRILFLSYKFHPDIGGIEVNSEILAIYFVRLGAEVHLVTTTSNDDGRIFPFRIIRNPNYITLLNEYSWADIVFENNPTLHLSWPLLIYKKLHVIAIRTWISRTGDTLSFRDRIKKLWLKKADSVIAVSEKIKESSFSQAVVIGNPYRNDLFKLFPEIKKDKDFIFLGRLVSDKGVDMAIEVLYLLHAENRNKTSNQTLTIVGDGPEMEKMKNLVAQYHLNNYVTFLGMLRGNELVDCLNRHKYLLVPSRWREPFGNVVLEGMACGCLPIVSDGSGLVDAVGNAGIVFERNNIHSMLGKIKELLTNPELESEKRNNAAKHLIRHHQETVAKRYYDVFLKAAKK